METCIGDDEIAERMDAGRRALMERGDNEVGPLPEPDGGRHAAPRVVSPRHGLQGLMREGLIAVKA